MRHLMAVAFLFFSLAGFAQDSASSFTAPDSQPARQSYIEVQRLEDSAERARSMERNMASLVRLQNENRSKQKKQALLRIVLGGFFLVVLIVGLTRRRMKKKQ